MRSQSIATTCDFLTITKIEHKQSHDSMYVASDVPGMH